MRKRIIPSLLLRGGRLVKGVSYAGHRDAGRADTTARAHNAQGADELLLLDIDASRENREPDFATIATVARECFMPLTVGGGIRTVDAAKKCLASGADKICVTSTALDDPSLIGQLAHVFGSQAVVLGIDVFDIGKSHKLYDHRTGQLVQGLDWKTWLQRGVAEGAGEIRLMSVGREGSRVGLDVGLLSEASSLVSVPIILEGGAGSLLQVAEALRAGADAVALGTMLVFSDNNIFKVRSFLKNADLDIRW